MMANRMEGGGRTTIMPMGAPSAPSQMMPGPPGGGVLQEGQGVAGIVAHGGAIVMMQGASVGLTSLAPPVTNPGGGSGGGLNPGMSISRAPNPPAALGAPSFACFSPPPPGEPGLAIRKQRGREGKEARSRPYNKARCPHNRDHYSCRECGGAGICMHKKRKSQCRECGGKSVCQHNRVRSYCKECGGGGLCQHNRVRSKCKDCGGSGICKHGRHKNLCRDCGGSGICIHKHQKNKCRKCQKLNTCGHKTARKLCTECKILRDAGPEALALKIHEVLAVLEEGEMLDSGHPAHAQISEKNPTAQQDKQKVLLLHKKRKREEMLTGYSMGVYPGLPPDVANSAQYQHMAANYYQQMQLMQQHMSRKPSKTSRKAELEMSRNSADRIDAINKLYLQGLKEIKGLLEEGVLSQEEFETEKQRLYRKKEESLSKQREDEAAIQGIDGVPLEMRGFVGDTYQQALAMYYSGQQSGGKKMDAKETMSEEADDDDEELPDEARDQPLPPQTPSKDADPLSASKAEGATAGAADVAGTQSVGAEMSGVMPGKVGKVAVDGKRGMPLPLPMPFMPLGFGGFGAQFPPFPSFPFPPAHPPNNSAGKKLARATGFVDGTVDAGAKKRGRPRKNLLPEAQYDATRVQAAAVPPEPPAEDRLPISKATGAEGPASSAAPPLPAPPSVAPVGDGA